MATRSTDVSDIHNCPGSWFLKNFYEEEKAEASYFHLGSQLHETIEVSIVMDLDLDAALRHADAGIDRRLEVLDAAPKVLESSKRGVDSMRGDAETMIRNWFRTVHPDSPSRMAAYDELVWPPATEVAFQRQDVGTRYPVWGSIDALFTRKDHAPHFTLVDWKSSSTKLKDSHQLHFYMFGLGEPEADAWFHRLPMQQGRSVIQKADPYPGDDAVRQRILATEAIKDSIIEGSYPRFNPDWYCGYCPVQHVCPADGDVRNRDENAVNLRRMLRLARPMIEIERRAS